MTLAVHEFETVWDVETELIDLDVAYAAKSYDSREISPWYNCFIDGVMSAALANHPRGKYLLSLITDYEIIHNNHEAAPHSELTHSISTNGQRPTEDIYGTLQLLDASIELIDSIVLPKTSPELND